MIEPAFLLFLEDGTTVSTRDGDVDASSLAAFECHQRGCQYVCRTPNGDAYVEIDAVDTIVDLSDQALKPVSLESQHE